MAKEFYCKYKMNSPMTGCKASIVVKRNEEDALIIKYKFSEVENDYKEDGQAPVSEDIIKEVRDLVNRHMVSLKVNMVPGSITDTADESFEVDIDGRCHIFKSENLVNMTNDATVEDAEYAGLNKVAEIVSNGSAIAGVVYDMMPSEAQQALDEADIILAKGMGNYESMYGLGWHAFFEFLCKCELFINRFNVPKLTGMFIEEK